MLKSRRVKVRGNDNTGVARFLKSCNPGDVRYFEGVDMKGLQVTVHSTCQRLGKKASCSSFLAVSNGLEVTVKLLRVEILNGECNG